MRCHFRSKVNRFLDTRSFLLWYVPNDVIIRVIHCMSLDYMCPNMDCYLDISQNQSYYDLLNILPLSNFYVWQHVYGEEEKLLRTGTFAVWPNQELFTFRRHNLLQMGSFEYF